MKLYIASDHRGYKLKEELIPLLLQKGNEVVDLGAHQYDKSDDYTDYAIKLGRIVADESGAKGILLCGSGIGMVVAANKVQGVIASLVDSAEEARQDRIEHDTNVLVLPAGDFANKTDTVQKVVESWLSAEFAGGRHLRRLNEIRYFEKLQALPYSTKALITPTALEREISEVRRIVKECQKFAPIINIDLISSNFVEGGTISFTELYSFLDEDQNKDELFIVHLMYEDPYPYLLELNNLKNVYTVHIHHEAEITENILKKDNEWSFQLGLTLNPSTQIDEVDFEKFEIIQLMTVEPGAQGHEFLPGVLRKVESLRENGFTGKIHLDGGISPQTLPQALAVSPEILSVGSAIVKSENPENTYFEMVKIIENYYAKNN